MALPRRRTSAIWRVVMGVGVGMLFTLPALLLAFISAGGGHGDYLWAKVFFPYSMILLPGLSGEVGEPCGLSAILVLGVGLLQFPLYGAVLGASASSFRRMAMVVAIILAVHAAAAAACFIFPSAGYS